MEDVEAWIAEQGSYQVGMQLYLQHPYHNKNLARIIGSRENSRNRAKLEYELLKSYKAKALKDKAATQQKKATQVIPANNPEKDLREQATIKFQGKTGLADLHPSLHPKYILQKSTFYKIWGLHYNLENLDSDEKRLESLREIMAGWDLINSIWQEIDYYLEHKKVLAPTDVSDLKQLNPSLLAQRKLTVRSNVSRYQKKVKQLSADHVAEEDLALKNKILLKLNKAQDTLGKNEIRLAEIKQLLHE
jgi:hypothetical protein